MELRVVPPRGGGTDGESCALALAATAICASLAKVERNGGGLVPGSGGGNGGGDGSGNKGDDDEEGDNGAGGEAGTWAGSCNAGPPYVLSEASKMLWWPRRAAGLVGGLLALASSPVVGDDPPASSGLAPVPSPPAPLGGAKSLEILLMPIIFRRACRMASLLLESMASGGMTKVASGVASPPLAGGASGGGEAGGSNRGGGDRGGEGNVEMEDVALLLAPNSGSSTLGLDKNVSEEPSWMVTSPMGGGREADGWPSSSSCASGMGGGVEAGGRLLPSMAGWPVAVVHA